MSAIDRYASRRRRGGRRRGLGRTQPYRKRFNYTNVMAVKHRSGHYSLRPGGWKREYHGSSGDVGSRLEDFYRRRGDTRTVKSKAELRELMDRRDSTFDIHYDTDVGANREAEMRLKRKDKSPFNVK